MLTGERARLLDSLHELLDVSEPFEVHAPTAAEKRHLRACAERARSSLAALVEDRALSPAGHATVSNGVEGLIAQQSEAAYDIAGWRAARIVLAFACDSLRRELGARLADPERHSRKKPRNWARTSFHVLSGVVWVLLYQYVVDQRTLLWMVAGWLVFFLVDDALRRWLPTKRSHLAVATFRALARSSESVRIASSTWYTLGLLVCVAALPKPACIVGLLILGLADPMAGLVGRRWGYTKLHRDKSVQGTLAFFATAMVVAVTSLSIHIPWMGLGEQLWAAMLIAASGAAAELAGDHVADNFSVPVITGMVAAFVGL